MLFRLSRDSGEILWSARLKQVTMGRSTAIGHTTLALSPSAGELFYGVHGRLGGVLFVSLTIQLFRILSFSHSLSQGFCECVLLVVNREMLPIVTGCQMLPSY